MKAAFCTLGCKVNQYDTDAMREMFVKAGHEIVDFEDKADVYIINTCTVTATGDKKSRQMASRAHTLCPTAKIIITGCYAQTAPEEVLSLPGVSLVLGTAQRSKIVELAENLPDSPVEESKFSAVIPHGAKTEFEELSVSREGRTRAYLKIEDGCDRYCTYCIIPYARGPVRSRTLGDIRTQLELLNNEGYHEVVLTGIHLMSYGKDIKNATLGDAIKQAQGLNNIVRIRLGSLEPQLLSDEFIGAIKQSGVVCPQFHLSLQSGSATVLKRMNRRYSPGVYEACVEKLRSAMPNCAITTDVIVGFPGETEEEFEETLAFVKKLKLAKIHVFPYSRRKGTVAYSMENQVPSEVKKTRAAQLIAVAKQLEQNYMQTMVGKTQNVLFEEIKNSCIWGHTDTYVKVGVKCTDEALINTIVPVRITGINRLGAVGTAEK